ncbi:MAG: helix-turn-helix transcriptional regulator [Ktedonobacteraceae bacterium]|nr:helix-turn-helix transcriptional regulator [Ktedonobacteraceae bacterium]
MESLPLHHHGIVIKEARQAAYMTQEELAEVWPKAGGGVGVSSRYVQDVEYGNRRLESDYTLRKLAEILDIPLWKFGLSDYNPFDPFHPQNLPGQGKSMFAETLATTECLVQHVWLLRLTSPAFHAENSLQRLNRLFRFFHEHLPPSSLLEKHYLRLYADVQCLNGVMRVEYKHYAEAINTFEGMYQTAKALGNPATLAHALMNLAVESERGGAKKQAIDMLEEARDLSFQAPKPIAALVNSYLSRVYASDGDALRFQRTNDTARTLGTHLKKDFSEDTDSVFYTESDILAERSYGYLEVGEPQKTLDLKDEITKQLRKENNFRLEVWIALDWARAQMMLGEIEGSVEAAKLFFHRASALRSPHAQSRAYSFLKTLEEKGYADVQAVKDFCEELNEAKQLQEKKMKST